MRGKEPSNIPKLPVPDSEHLAALNDAIARNRGKRLIPWASAKRDLGLDD